MASLFLVYHAAVFAQDGCIANALAIQKKAKTLLEKKVDTLDVVLKDLQTARSCFEKHQHWVPLVNNYLLSSLMLSALGDSTALSTIDQGIQVLSEKIPANDSLLAHLYHKKGVLYYNQFDDQNAIRYYQKSIRLRTHFLPPSHQEIIIGYRNIGGCFNYLNQLDSSFFYLEKAAVLAQKNEQIPTLLKQQIIQLNGRVLHDFGDYDAAKNKYEEALLYIDRDNYFRDYLGLVNDLGRVLIALERINDAKELLTPYTQNKQGKSHKDLYADIFNNMGLIYDKLNQDSIAIEYYNQSLAINQALKGRESYRSKIYNNLSVISNKRAKYHEAINYLEKSTSYTTDNFELADIEDNMGDSYYGLKRYQVALDYYQSSILKSFKNFNAESLFSLPSITTDTINTKDRTALLITLRSKARTLQKIYAQSPADSILTATFRTYQMADELIDLIRKGHLAEGSKYSLASTARPLYEEAVDFCFSQYYRTQSSEWLEEAFYFFEKSKGVLLLESLRQNQVYGHLPDSLREREKQIDLGIRFYEQSNTVEKLTHLRKEREQLLQLFKTAYPAYYASKFNPKPVALDTIRAALASDELLIQYFQGERQTYWIAVAPTGRIIGDTLTTPSDSLVQLVDWMMDGIYAKKLNKPNAVPTAGMEDWHHQYATSAHALYLHLLAPALSSHEVDPAKLTVIPDNALNRLPFDALLQQPVPASSWKNARYQNKTYQYLVRNYTVRYAYSASLLHEMTRLQHTDRRAALLAFNTKAFKGQIEKIQAVFCKNNLLYYFVDPLFERSTKASLQDKITDYRYLHFSVHGVMNEENPNQSHLILENTPNDADSLLYLYELYNLPLSLDLVVTAACDVGTGKLNRGEGVISLARGFAYAGTKSIVTTLWSVHGQSTGTVLQSFYRELRDGHSKDIALTTAKRRFLLEETEELAHPFYWAGIIPIGDMAAIDAATPWSKWIGLLLLGCGLIGGLVLLKSVLSFRDLGHS